MAAWADNWSGTNCTMVSAATFTILLSSGLALGGGIAVDASYSFHETAPSWVQPYYVDGRGFRDERQARLYANLLHEKDSRVLVARERAPATPCKMRLRLPPRVMVSSSQKRANKRKSYLRRIR